MKTKKVIFFVVVLILIVILGIFLWEAFKQPVDKDFALWEMERIGGYNIEDDIEGKTITNKEYGLIVRAPKGWTVVDYDIDGVGMFSPEVEFNEYGGFLRSAKENGGCIVGAGMEKSIKLDSEQTTDVEKLVALMQTIKKEPVEVQEENTKYEIIIVDGKEGVKTTLLNGGKESDITVEIPIDDLIYSFVTGTIYSEKCILEFDKILETVKIGK